MTTVSFPNGDSYVGAVDDKSRPHGHGTYTRLNGAVYVGEHVHGQRHGVGEFRSTDGSTYRGQWAHGVQHGHGVYVFGAATPWAGDEYRGQFVDGAWNGEGEHRFANGDHYVGDYRDGKQHGVGKFTNANGSAYVGQFRAGVPHGQGAFFLKGRRIARTTGQYEQGVLAHSDKSVPDDAPEPSLAELRRLFPPPPVVPRVPSTSSLSSTDSPVAARRTNSVSSVTSATTTVDDDADADDDDDDVIIVDPSAVAVATTVSSASLVRRSHKKKHSGHNKAPVAAAAAVSSPSSSAPSSPVVSGSGAREPLAALEAKARELRRQLIAVEQLISARGTKGSLRDIVKSPAREPAAAAPDSPGGDERKVSVTSDFAERPLLARPEAAIARLHLDATSSVGIDDDTEDATNNDEAETTVDGVKRVNFRRRIKQLLFSSQAASDMAVSQSQVLIDIEQLHKAELLEPLGGGGSGCKIYRASVKGFSFVVKLYRTAALTPLDEELIKKEILIMEALDHPNIVHYIGHDFHSQPDCVRLYMELFLATLHRDIRNRAEATPKGAYVVDELLALMLGIASGLQYLHTLPCPIVHRDLKSENVFLVAGADKGDVRVKIGDFGEAKAMQGQDKWLNTRHVGSAEFRAPEVYGSKARVYNEKADIWSFGMVIFELLTLDLPYRATVKSHFEIPALVEKGIRATLPDLPPSYADVLPMYLTCTEADPKERPPAKELVKRLKKMAAKRAEQKKAAKDAKAKQ